MKNLFIDIETFSSVNLIKAGVYKYTQSNDFEILLFGYSIDDCDYGDDGNDKDNGKEVKIVDLASGEEIPNEILKALEDKNVMKWAHNAAFERICLSKYLHNRFANKSKNNSECFKEFLNPESWRCTLVWCAYLGLPLSLKTAGEVLRIEKQKMSEGKDLVRYFSMPQKLNTGATVKCGIECGVKRNLPKNNPEKWNKFKEYNKRDVETEIAIYNRLKKFPMPELEWENYILDQKINDCGIMLDSRLVKNALIFSEKSSLKLISEIKEITGIENPRSVHQLKIWLSENDLKTDSLGKKDVEKLLKSKELQNNKNIKILEKVLKLRQNLAKSSIKKYEAMKNCCCKDKRARGLFQFYGANRTGRWAGRLIQLQNLPQNHVQSLVMARELVKTGDYGALSYVYDSVPAVLSELIRTAFIPEKGKKFIVADFSAIEARVISWLAGEKWRNEVFSSHGKIYEASASRMFKVSLDEITKDSPLRQKGKIAELALGYGGSVGALKAMGALEMGLSPEELQPLVDSWRMANPNIVKLWYEVGRNVIRTVKNKASLFYAGSIGSFGLPGLSESYSNSLVIPASSTFPTSSTSFTSFLSPLIGFEYQSGLLMIKLPSGRKLSYVRPRIEPNKFGGMSVTYEGKSTVKDARKIIKSKIIGWARIESYGAKFVENIIQATARDLLCHAMKNLDDEGYRIVMHCHDEVVIEVPNGNRRQNETISSDSADVRKVCDIMCKSPDWAKGLALKAEGFECDFYRKA
ncbi:MAG: DNA polymerase [Oscillospiraceae bacterium]|jgi:DNA polymerase|nr:DNA polymerase [Oscillospiraceae bacterium]